MQGSSSSLLVLSATETAWHEPEQSVIATPPPRGDDPLSLHQGELPQIRPKDKVLISIRRRKKRIILVLSSLVMFGLYYLIAMPATVRQHLKETMPKDDNFESKFQLLFTLAHLPGVFLPFVAGVVEDNLGGSVCVLALSTTCLVGQLISSLGVQKENWPALILGRFVYGVGFESLFVANQGFLATWFEDAELGWALGVSSATSYVGYVLSFIVSPIVANRVTVAFSFWLAAMAKGLGFVSAVIMFIYCRRDEQIARSEAAERRPSTVSRSNSSSMSQSVEEGSVSDCLPTQPSQQNGETENESTATDGHNSDRRFPGCASFGLPLYLLCFSSLLQYSIIVPFFNSGSGFLLEHSLFVEPPSDCKLVNPDECSSGYLAPSNGNPAVNENGGVCPLGEKYAPVIPSSLRMTGPDGGKYIFNPLERADIDCADAFWAEACTQNYCDQQKEATEKAGLLSSFPFIVTVLTTFLFGRYAVDLAGLRAEMLVLAPALTAGAHAMLTFQRNPPLAPLIMMGFGYSMSVSAIWPSVPLLVSEKVVGAAFGLVTCVQNIGLSMIPLMVAGVYNNFGHRYLPGVGIFFLSCSIIAVLVSVALLVADRMSGGRLRMRDVAQSRGSHQPSVSRQNSKVHCAPEPSY